MTLRIIPYEHMDDVLEIADNFDCRKPMMSDSNTFILFKFLTVVTKCETLQLCERYTLQRMARLRGATLGLHLLAAMRRAALL
jgi:hypothetical protein